MMMHAHDPHMKMHPGFVGMYGAMPGMGYTILDPTPLPPPPYTLTLPHPTPSPPTPYTPYTLTPRPSCTLHLTP